MRTCKMCNTKYRGSVCPACGTVFTTTEYTSKWPAAGYAPHWRAILRYDALIREVWIVSTTLFALAWIMCIVTSAGKSLSVLFANVASWYIFTAFLCWLFCFPKTEPMSRHEKLLTAAISACGCIALRLILSTASGMITGIFIPLCTLAAAYIIPLVVVYKLRNSHVEELRNVRISQTEWDRFAASLEKDWNSSKKQMASETFKTDIHKRYAHRLDEILVSIVDLT